MAAGGGQDLPGPSRRPAARRQRFKFYVEKTWLPHHVMEATTREGYTYQIDKHVMPWFGGMKMAEILPSDVREWVTLLKSLKVVKDKEEKPALSPTTIRNLRNLRLHRHLDPLDRIGADRPFYSGKHRRHGMNLQVISAPDGEILWVSGPPPAPALRRGPGRRQ